MSKDTLYIGVEPNGVLEIGDENMSWNNYHQWWIGPNSSNVSKPGARLLKRVLNLDVWPEPGELLVYDIVKEKGYIVSHNDL